MFDCGGVIDIQIKYSKKASEVKTKTQSSRIKISLKQCCQASINQGLSLALFEDLMSSVSKIALSQVARIYRKLPIINLPLI